jgi:hypothetical protein
MPRIIVRKGYRCLPGKRREVLAALQRVDEAAAGAGWPRGRYLFVETRAPGEPDLEVEFAFESYAEMERLERRLREHLARAAREVALAGQEHLLEPSATRHLLLLDEPGARSAPASPPAAVASPTAAPPAPVAAPPPAPVERGAPPPPPSPPPRPPEAALTPAQQRARQLAAARTAMESAESTAGVPLEKRSSQRRQAPPPPAPDEPDEPEGEDEAALGETA